MAKITREARGLINKFMEELKPEPKIRAGQPVYRKQAIDGIELLRSNALDANGRPGVPGVTYLAPVLVYEDHRANMENAFKYEGMEGITKYADMVNRRQHEREIFVEKANETVYDSHFERTWVKIKLFIRRALTKHVK